MKKYTILFCEDNKICFQGEGGIENPEDILCTGKILEFSDTKEVKNNGDLMFKTFTNREFIFVPNL